MSSTTNTARLVLPDSKALSLFEHDPCVKIIYKQKELPGYELYVVEQWATSREHLTSLITTFTGLTHHKIKVYVLEIPDDEAEWSVRLRTYVENISKPPARRKETAFGTLMVTNLSSFASTLTVVNIPGGDYDDYKDIFIVNENLKRLGCSGRAGLNLLAPSGATQAKFRHLYHTSEAVPVTEAAVELVRLCQVALVLYSQLAREYTDGLLCDITIEAIQNWWSQIGSEHFNIEPDDGSLGPTTVAAILGLLQGARIRLQSLNAPIGKDVFDLRSTKRAIEAFQKWYKLDRTRRLDTKTLDRLHKLTSKSVNSESWVVPRAVKSTIPQLGKGGEMVMGIVSNKDRAGIGDVETLDINTFASTVSGDSIRWLWQGKRRKGGLDDSLGRFSSDEEIFSADDTPPRTYRKRDIVLERMPALGNRADSFYNNHAGSQASLDPSDREQSMHKNVLKSVTGRMSDAKSGLGRFREAVGIPGFRGHASRLSKEQSSFSNESLLKSGSEDVRSVSGGTQVSNGFSEPFIKDAGPNQTQSNASEKSPPALRLKKDTILQLPSVTGKEIVFTPKELEPEDKQLGEPPDYTPSSVSQNDVDSPVPKSGQLIRSQSYDTKFRVSDVPNKIHQRALSFGDITSALMHQSQLEDAPDNNLAAEYAHNLYLTEVALSLKKQLQELEARDLPRTQRMLEDMQENDTQLVEDLEEIDKQYFSLLGEYDEQQQATAATMTTAKSTIGDTLLRIEGVMAKLEYELNMLASKVEDVEDGVADFEDQVLSLELRAQALEPKQKQPSSWPLRLLALLLGFV